MMRFRDPFDPGWHHSGWHDVLGWLLPTLFFIALIALAVWVVIRVTGPGRPAPAGAHYLPPPSRTDSAVEQVRLRYARGEISRDEFVQLASDLGWPAGEQGPPPEGGS